MDHITIDGGRRKGLTRCLPFALFIALVFALLVVQSYVIPCVDNYFISMVSNGLYGSNIYCLFINPVLSHMIYALASVDPSIDWFTWISRFFSFLAVLWVGYCVHKSDLSLFARVTIAVILLFLVIDNQLFTSNFTIFSGFYAAVAWFSASIYVRGEHGVNSQSFRRIALAAAVVFFAASLLYRWECALLAVPFMVLDFAPVSLSKMGLKLNQTETNQLGSSVCGVVVVLAVCLALALSSALLNRTQNYDEAVEYNDARCALVDYPTKAYEEIEDSLPWLSQNDYTLVQAWFFADTDYYDTEGLRAIADVAQTTAVPSLLSVELLEQLSLALLGNPAYLLLLLITAAALFVRADAAFRVKLVLGFLGAACIFAYYYYVGRLPFRVIVSVYFFLFVLMLNRVICSDVFVAKEGACHITLRAAVPLALSVVVCFSMIPAWLDLYRNSFVQELDESALVQPEDLGDDYIVLWSSAAYVDSFRYAGVMPSAEYLMHNVPTGTWVYGQPYFMVFLESRDISNPVLAMIDREDVYYRAWSCDAVHEFIREHYNENISVRQVGELEGAPLWVFVQ